MAGDGWNQIAIGGRVGGGQLSVEGLELDAGLVARDAVAEPSDNPETEARGGQPSLQQVGVWHEWHPEALPHWEIEPLRHHADDGCGCAVDLDSGPNGIRTPAEAADPESVIEDRH